MSTGLENIADEDVIAQLREHLAGLPFDVERFIHEIYMRLLRYQAFALSVGTATIPLLEEAKALTIFRTGLEEPLADDEPAP